MKSAEFKIENIFPPAIIASKVKDGLILIFSETLGRHIMPGKANKGIKRWKRTQKHGYTNANNIRYEIFVCRITKAQGILQKELRIGTRYVLS